MRRLISILLLTVSNFSLAGNLQDYIQSEINMGSKPPAKETQQKLKDLFCNNGTDCSYSGVDYKSFSKENEAKNKYLEKANNPKDPLGMGLSTIWSLSEIKSTEPYKEAEKLYKCVKFSPDGKCEMYQAETYYGECKTVKECVSWNTQKFYANYTCTVDTLSQRENGETENLCFKYNVIKPSLKEKYFTCFVSQNEGEKICYKQRIISFGNCNAPGSGTSATYTLLSGCFGTKCGCEDTDPRRLFACGKRVTGNLSVPYGGKIILKWSTCCVCDDDEGRLEMHIKGNTKWGTTFQYDYDKTCPSGGEVVLTTASGGWISYDVAYYDTHGGDGATIQIVAYVPYKCSLTGETFNDKYSCYSHCYTEKIQDCSINQ
jgi:hypothetical protein